MIAVPLKLLLLSFAVYLGWTALGHPGVPGYEVRLLVGAIAVALIAWEVRDGVRALLGMGRKRGRR